MQNNLFKRHKKKTFCVIHLILTVLLIVLAEIILRLAGLGKPILYDSNPFYGFRPLPNHTYIRFGGSRVAFNNLGLRTDTEWDDQRNNKILFLGDSVTYGGSYIDNTELFTSLIEQELLGYQCANGGVNAWGIENIYGLVMESEFMPAQVYVTVVPEGDFYRGLTRCQGMPFFNRSPGSALEELWRYFCWKQNNRRYKVWTAFANEEETYKVIDKAVRKLKEMDSVLAEKGYRHFVFISPDQGHMNGTHPKNPLLMKSLQQHDLQVTYLQDLFKQTPHAIQDIPSLFHDGLHLSKKGHAAWGRVLAGELKKRLSQTSSIEKN
ncbi:MAG: hypothetical protein JXA82_01075 [Sedimentisphaerales bacterium]|nr:hypothetical protein [Sedimentisphaerales bacterium]